MAVSTLESSRRFQQQLQHLAALQELDNEIIAVEIKRDKIPERLETMEDGLLTRRKRFEEKENQVSTLEEEMNEKQRALELERIKLKNTRNKETAIQNIKQYEAYVKEMENKEKSSEDLEAEITAIKTRIEDLRKDQAELEKEISRISKEATDHQKELEGQLAEFDTMLEELYNRRDEMAEKLDEDLYLKYEYIAERKDGVAVAIVEHGHCVACNMAIPPQMYNELIRCDHLMACPACSRILVLKDLGKIHENLAKQQESHDEEDEDLDA